jgi:hypothetical protein
MGSPAQLPTIEYPPWLGARAGGPGAKGAPPPPDPDKWIKDMKPYFSSPADKAFLDDLIARGVTVTAYDRIYFDDPYYDGTKWTTKRFEAGGTAGGPTEVNILRGPNAANNASTLFHEGVHTSQPRSMAWRDKEYDAYKKQDAWLIDHGLPPHHPSFRTTDPGTGKAVTNEAGIKAFVDKEYPGVSVPGPGGTTERVVDKDDRGNSVVERSDGTRYTRPPRAGDSFPGPQMTEPPGGVPVDLKKLR